MDAKYVQDLYKSQIKNIVEEHQLTFYKMVPIMEPEYAPMYNILLNLSRYIPELLYKCAENRNIDDDVVTMLKSNIPNYSPNAEPYRRDLLFPRCGIVYKKPDVLETLILMTKEICHDRFIEDNVKKVYNLLAVFYDICQAPSREDDSRYTYDSYLGRNMKETYLYMIKCRLKYGDDWPVPFYYMINPSEIEKAMSYYFNKCLH